MLFSGQECKAIYGDIYDWLTVHTPGEPRSISTLKYYTKEVWSPIYRLMIELQSKTILTDLEREFLDSAVYNGPIYRIQNYNPRREGFIYEHANYQSWSYTVDGLLNVTNITGRVLFIAGTAHNGINIFGLLCFLLEHQNLTGITTYKKPINLCRYENEDEIVYPMMFNSITDMVAIEKIDLQHWETQGIRVPSSKWQRNRFR